jgi:hypothetical protein
MDPLQEPAQDVDGASEDSEAGLVKDGSGIEVGPWDPVWHQASPTQWPEVPKGTRPDCGSHCRVIASSLPHASPQRAPRANARWVAIMGNPSGKIAEQPVAVAVDLSAAGGPREYLIDDGTWIPNKWGVSQLAVDGDIALYVAGAEVEKYVVMRHLVTGERKLVWAVPMQGTSPGTVGTALAFPYAYWMAVPGDVFYRFDTRDGTLKWSMQAGTCEFISGTSTGLGACASAGAGLVVVDFDKGTASYITSKQYQQTNGMLSQDGKHAIWIDFRDPGANNEHGSWHNPWGGEVYHKLLDGSAEERLTQDTPTSPTMKTSPWVQDGNFSWITMAGTDAPNPTGSSIFWYTWGYAVVKPEGGPAVTLPLKNVRFPRAVGPGIVAIWLDETTKREWVVLLDWP